MYSYADIVKSNKLQLKLLSEVNQKKFYALSKEQESSITNKCCYSSLLCLCFIYFCDENYIERLLSSNVIIGSKMGQNITSASYLWSLVNFFSLLITLYYIQFNSMDMLNFQHACVGNLKQKINLRMSTRSKTACFSPIERCQLICAMTSKQHMLLF